MAFDVLPEDDNNLEGSLMRDIGDLFAAVPGEAEDEVQNAPLLLRKSLTMIHSPM
jgi:hypothetical protein